jgi:hypothetical protein
VAFGGTPESLRLDSLPEGTELVSLLPFAAAQKRRLAGAEREQHATKRQRRGAAAAAGEGAGAALPGDLPSAALAVPGAREATRVRLAAGSLAWVRRQSRGSAGAQQWHPVKVETETYESDGRVVVLPLCPPHTRTSVLVEDVRAHAEAMDWQALRDQTLQSLAAEGAGAVSSYEDAVAALLRKHTASAQQEQRRQPPQPQPQGRAPGAAAMRSGGRAGASSSSSSGRPLRIGGVPCVVMDSHSKLPMKLRHRVLGKLVEALAAAAAPPGVARGNRNNGSSSSSSSSSSGGGSSSSSNKAPGTSDETIIEGREVEAELYSASSSKNEYQNKAMSRIKTLRAEKQQQRQHEVATDQAGDPSPSSGGLGPSSSRSRVAKADGNSDTPSHSSSNGGESSSSEYALRPEDLVLSAADLALNLFPMTPDMVLA